MDSGSIFQIIILIILLLLSAFFSSAETALTTVNRIRMRSLAEDGNSRAACVLKVTDDSGKMLSAILIGNNIVNLSASSIATSLALDLWGSVGAGIATGILTLLILIFGEISPKTIATINAEKISLSYCNIIYWLIFSIACIVLGAFLAKKRKAERAQSAFAFHLPCYIIKVLVSFLAGMFLGVLFGSVNVLGGYAGFVFGFILASVPVYIIVHLILYRGFSKLIKTSIPLGALIIVSCVGVALCCFDAFGYNSYVPKTQDIKSAGFYDANSNYQAKGSAVGKNLKDMADDITDKDTIANILEAHYQLVDKRNYSIQNKFKNTWVSMFKDNVPVFSEISKNPDYAFAYTLNNGNIVTRTYSSASAFEETESYLSSTYNELDTSDIIYSKGYIKAYSPLVKADYKDINTFIVAGFDGKATDDKHPDFVSSKIIYTDDDGTVNYSKNYKNTAEKIKEAFLKDLDNCSDEDFAKIDQMTEYADHALDVAYVNYGEYESFIKSEPDAVCVIAIATGDVNSYYDGIRNMDSYNGNTAARTQVVYTVPKSFKNTIKALQELGILNSKLYMDKDYLPGDSTSYKEYTGEYYYDDYTSSSDLYDYTDDSYIDDSEY